MNTEDFLDLFNQALKRDRGKFVTGPSLEEVTKAAVWFMSLHDAEQNHECNTLKDWADIFQNGLPALKDMDPQEWLDAEAEYWDDPDETFEQYVIRRMLEWGWK